MGVLNGSVLVFNGSVWVPVSDFLRLVEFMTSPVLLNRARIRPWDHSLTRRVYKEHTWKPRS